VIPAEPQALILLGQDFRTASTGYCAEKGIGRLPESASAVAAGAHLKHGLYSTEARAEQKLVRELLQQSRELLNRMQTS
jgi:hypothetical protein